MSSKLSFESSTPGISLVIPTLGQVDNLSDLFNSIQDQQGITLFEVLLVDNSLDPQIKNQLKNLCSKYGSPFKYIECLNQGVNYARNLGLKLCQHSIVLFLDDDCYLQDRFLLKKHMTFHLTHPEYFAMGGVYSLADDASFIQKHYHLLQMIWLQSGVYSDQSIGKTNTRYLIGGHFSLKKEIALINQLKFDEKIIFGGSELSLFGQAIKLNLKMSLQDLSVFHHSKVTFIQLIRKLYKQGQGKAYLQEAEDPIFYNSKPDLSFVSKVFISIMNSCFWFGYYQFNKNYFGLIVRFFSLVKNIFLNLRGTLIQHLYKIEKEKNDRGDRF